MARQRTGSAVARKIKKGNRTQTIWYARVTYIDNGKRKQQCQKALNKSDAKDRAKQMLRDLDDHGEETLNAARMTFAQLADYYKKKYLKEAQYIDGRKIEGLRSLDSVISRWTTIKDYFAKKRLRS